MLTSPRLFFFAATLCAVLIGAVWMPWFLGLWRVPTGFTLPVWFTHELLFGVALAALAGVLCRQRAVHRGGAAALLVSWLLTRAAVAVLPEESLSIVMALSIACSVLLIILSGRHWQVTLPTIALLAVQVLFLWEVWRFGRSTYGGWLGASVLLLWGVLVLRKQALWFWLLGGVLLIGADIAIGPQRYSVALMQAWMLGAVGLVVLIALPQGKLRTLALLCVVVAVFARVAMALSPAWTMALVPLSGVSWVLAFLMGSGLALRRP